MINWHYNSRPSLPIFPPVPGDGWIVLWNAAAKRFYYLTPEFPDIGRCKISYPYHCNRYIRRGLIEDSVKKQLAFTVGQAELRMQPGVLIYYEQTMVKLWSSKNLIKLWSTYGNILQNYLPSYGHQWVFSMLFPN